MNRQGDFQFNAGTPSSMPEVLLVQGILTMKGLQLTFNVDVFPEPETWGLFLADLARHVSDAYEEAHGLPKAKTLREVIDIFHAEIDRPTETPRGGLHSSN